MILTTKYDSKMTVLQKKNLRVFFLQTALILELKIKPPEFKSRGEGCAIFLLYISDCPANNYRVQT